MKFLWLLLIVMLPSPAAAEQFSNCSQTVGTASAPVPATTKPQQFIEVCNAHATNTLGVNFVGGAAAIGSAGTVTLAPGACKRWEGAGLPVSLAVIGSAASTTTACGFY